MKVEYVICLSSAYKYQEEQFQPVVITLETKDEVRAIRMALAQVKSANLLVIELSEHLHMVPL